MAKSLRMLMLVSAAAVLLAIVVVEVRQASSQNVTVARSAVGRFPSEYDVPRMPDGNPDLNGIWQQFTTANWDILDHAAAAGPMSESMGVYSTQPAGLGIVEGNEIPYQPWALEKKKENFAQRLAADPFHLEIGDPEAKCYLAGVPRSTYEPFPFQIIQGTGDILIGYEYANTSRVIHMGKMKPPVTDSWMGQSEGHFEGDTLVVSVTGFNDRSWFDRSGDFHSEALKVTERYTPVSPYHMMYEATIEDPKVFTRPWKMSFPLYRRMEENAALLEFSCVEFVEPFLYRTLSVEGRK